MIDLKSEDAIAFGGEREIHPFPGDPSRILKVLVAPERQSKGGFARAMSKRWFGGYRAWLIRREYEEYLRLSLNCMMRTRPLPISHMFGFMATNRGMACVSETVRSEDGRLGPSLKSLIERGNIGEREVAALTEMGADLVRIGARCSDLTASNVVLGYRSAYGDIGRYEAVLIDGFGDTHAVPVRSLSKRANIAALHRRLERIGRQAGLTWDREGLRYRSDDAL